jgi:hypothetical protein
MDKEKLKRLTTNAMQRYAIPPRYIEDVEQEILIADWQRKHCLSAVQRWWQDEKEQTIAQIDPKIIEAMIDSENYDQYHGYKSDDV